MMRTALRAFSGTVVGAVLFVTLWLAGALLLISLSPGGVAQASRAPLHRWLMVTLVAPAGGVVSGWLARRVGGTIASATVLAVLVVTGMAWSFFTDLPALGVGSVAYVAAIMAGGWLGGGRREEFSQRGGLIEQARKERRTTGTWQWAPGCSREDDRLSKQGLSRC